METSLFKSEFASLKNNTYENLKDMTQIKHCNFWQNIIVFDVATYSI